MTIQSKNSNEDIDSDYKIISRFEMQAGENSFNKISTKESNQLHAMETENKHSKKTHQKEIVDLKRLQITRTLGRQMGHEIQRNEILHNEHETEIELLLPTRSAHSQTSKDKSIIRT